MSPRPGRIVARFEPDFVRTIARDRNPGEVKSSPEFAHLREQIRTLVHQSEDLQELVS
jgi:taurine transport system ATP-binding protein